MTSLQYQYVVPPSFDLFFNLRLFIVENLASFRKYISWAHFETGLVKRLTKKLNKDLILMIVSLKGMEAIVKDFNEIQATSLHLKLESNINNYNKLFSELNDINFFGNEQLQEVCYELLNEYYTFQFSLKRIAFPENQTSETDIELIKIASQISSYSITQLDGCEL